MIHKNDCAFPRICVGLLFLFSSFAAFAQKQVNGTIKDAKGNSPVGFATITVKGTNVATVSNADGSFAIKVPAGNNTLIVSSVGFVTKEADASSGVVNILLTETTSS